ncbi:MAG: tyrosine-type recombinase/integrase [Pseudomonadota bacterium]
MEPKAVHLSDFIRLALNTGCRAGELLGLEWKRVDLKVGLIHLEAQHTKTGKRRSVPLNQTARQAIISRARFRAQHCPGSIWVFCDETGDKDCIGASKLRHCMSKGWNLGFPYSRSSAYVRGMARIGRCRIGRSAGPAGPLHG